jgi:hypothetical protein
MNRDTVMLGRIVVDTFTDSPMHNKKKRGRKIEEE